MAAPASAQTYYDGSSVLYSEPLPPPAGQSRYEDVSPPYATGSVPQYPRSGRYYIPSYENDEVAGRPGLPNRAPPPVYGHQLLSGVVEVDPEPIRPPRQEEKKPPARAGGLVGSRLR